MSGAEPGDESLAESSLLSHLLELRDRLLRAVISTFVIAVPCLYFANDIFTWLSEPLRRQLPAGARLIATSVVAPFMTPFKLALLAAVYFAMPVILFYAGSVFAYYVVFPVIFQFFVATTPVGVEMMTDMTAYMDFAVLLFFAFGLAFEIPVATVLLVRTGLVKRATLAGNRGYVLLAIFIIAAFLTPPDAVSQTMMAVPMYALYELGLFMSRVLVRDKAPDPERDPA
jgi:sec-independent protein translocase protein TatC